MSQSYLDKFRSSLPSTQGRQILNLLISKRDQGEIRTVDEFKARLKELTSQLLEERITPTLTQWLAVGGQDISSEQYNDMLTHIQNDLEAGFAEADNIDEIIAAHHNLIHEISLKALRFGVNELESKISLYEFLNRSTQGFDDALFNTFRESKNLQTSRSDSAASLVYADPRKSEVILNTQDAQIDLVGERLTLGASQEKQLQIREAQWLSNANSIRGELDVQFENSKISHIVDNQNNTYWVESILLSQVRSTGVPMEISLALAASQDVNFIEIEPAVEFPIVLTGIDYIDANNTRQSTGNSSILLRGPARINFEKITTSHLILKFRQDNYKESQFTTKPGTSLFHRAVLDQNSNDVDLVSISEDLQEILTSDFILSDVLGVTNPQQEQVKYYEYILGFDNIRVGFSIFTDRSIFVSSKKKVLSPGRVALRTQEIRPSQVSGSSSITLNPYSYPTRNSDEDSKFYHGVTEHYLVIQFFGEDNYLIATDTVPILPLGASRIYHEQMIFKFQTTGAQNPDVAQLRFYTNATENDVLTNSDVIVYRNGTPLVYGLSNDWVWVDPDDIADPAKNLGAVQTVAGAGSPMKRAIRIINTVRPLDIYTVSYNPTVSNTQTLPNNQNLFTLVDLVGDNSMRMVSDNLITIEPIRNSYLVEYAEVYLVIIMRRNSANQNFSPAVEEFMLVTGSRNQQKFVGDF